MSVVVQGRRQLRVARLLGTAIVSATAAAGCTTGAHGSSTTTTAPGPHHSVGIHTETLVDSSRPTPQNGSVPGHPGRTLVVSVYYPSAGGPGLAHDPAPDRSGGPYPLIVFAHGFPADPAGYGSLLAAWASAGYVVAAPMFPLTNPSAPGGPDLADYVNQPADMSFVVTELEAQSRAPTGPLAGMVDPGAVGAAGHSLGGVTTLGLVANSCCRDDRIKAAVVMAGDQLTFPNGQADFPSFPLLFVHGNADEVVPYVSSVVSFDAAQAPKGLLTILGGDHEAPVAGPAFDAAVRTTTAFFDLYLKHAGSIAQLRADGDTPKTRLILAVPGGGNVTIPLPKSTTRVLHAKVAPSTGLTDGEQVEVSWQGYAPGITVNVLECSVPVSGAQDCDLHRARVGLGDPTGSGSVLFTVHSGPIGTGTCDATHPQCVIAVNQGGSSNPSDTSLLPISFGR